MLSVYHYIDNTNLANTFKQGVHILKLLRDRTDLECAHTARRLFVKQFCVRSQPFCFFVKRGHELSIHFDDKVYNFFCFMNPSVTNI